MRASLRAAGSRRTSPAPWNAAVAPWREPSCPRRRPGRWHASSRSQRIEAYEAAREEANARFVAATAPAVARAAQGVLSSPPTAEQAAAIATDEDATLVLAGAGTGKTAVITGKIAHLVRNRGVPPREILVLAFNRKAAEEIRQRLPHDLAGAHVATFHAFGRRVIADVEVAPTLSKLAEDEAMLTAGHRSHPRRPGRRSTAEPRSRGLHHAPPRRTTARSSSSTPPASTTTTSAASELRTLSGDLVKSFEELEIANFLTQNSVNFHYEQPYPVETATPWHRQYRPDFYLPDHDIYIEHLALDRQGRPPRGLDWVRRGRRRGSATSTSGTGRG